jgi:vacuolar-type H+-ATPase subunit H
VVARNIAEKINFQTTQADSILYLPKGFSISKNERWRAQQVLLILQVPVGKRFFLDRSISKYNWFDVRYNRRGGIDVDDNWERTYGVESGKEYIMSPDGPKKIEDLDTDALNRGEYKEREREEVNEDTRNRKLDELKRKEEKIEEEKQKLLNKGRKNRTDTTGGYRYHQKAPANKTDSTPAKVNASV